jgi:hypothetical protein
MDECEVRTECPDRQRNRRQLPAFVAIVQVILGRTRMPHNRRVNSIDECVRYGDLAWNAPAMTVSLSVMTNNVSTLNEYTDG